MIQIDIEPVRITEITVSKGRRTAEVKDDPQGILIRPVADIIQNGRWRPGRSSCSGSWEKGKSEYQ